MKRLITIITLLTLVGCGGVSFINRGMEDLYTPEFTKQIEAAKSIYARGDSESALAQLAKIDEVKLLPSEKAMKRNLIGVINFTGENYEQAIYEFNIALSTSNLDRKLTAQIYLNLASSYYKLGDNEKTFSTLLLSDFKQLRGKEFENYHLLRQKVSKELGKNNYAVESLMWLLVGEKDIQALKTNSRMGELSAHYFSLDSSERMRLIKDFSDDQLLVVGYLTFLEVEQLFASAKREQAQELAEWMEDEFDGLPEIVSLAQRFKTKMTTFASLNQFSVGVILPLTGKKKGFGQRALEGIDFAVREYNAANKNTEGFVPIRLHVADSKGSSVVGKVKARELIEGNNVSILIGGLFSGEAISEYEVAKQYGTLFISLSQVYLEKVEKDHLLVEVPGSIESQVSVLYTPDFINTFGKKGAILYPDSERGKAYVDELWRKSQVSDVSIVSVHRYNKDSTDHRDTVEKLLGLRFKRERLEELNILKEIHKLEGSTTIRRIQTLKPEMDFDWVFVPSFPNDALQLIPSFSYYDAYGIPLIGSPSWRSQTISKQSYKLGKLFFVDSNVPSTDSNFVNKYETLYGNKPRVIEILGFDAFEIANNILRSGQYETRSALESSLRSGTSLIGKTGSWILDDNVWIKSMNMMSLYKGKTSKVGLEEKAE